MITCEKTVKLERRARDLYELYHHRAEPAGAGSFDRLGNRERQAWLEIAEASYDNSECRDCGAPLICQGCIDRAVDKKK